MKSTILVIKVTQLFIKNYCYLIFDKSSKDAVLVDPAWQMGKIEQLLAQHEVKLKAVLITHHHFDHVHLAESFAKKYALPVFMSQQEMEYYHFSCKNIQPIVSQDILQIGNLKITPLWTPGHTKGGISYWTADALFTGDTLFIEGCGLCSARGGDPSEMFDTLQYLRMLLPKETLIYPGHSFGQEPGKPFSYLLENNIYLQFKEREKFVEFRMRKNQSGLMNFK